MRTETWEALFGPASVIVLIARAPASDNDGDFDPPRHASRQPGQPPDWRFCFD
jgi:hypothetical protein